MTSSASRDISDCFEKEILTGLKKVDNVALGHVGDSDFFHVDWMRVREAARRHVDFLGAVTLGPRCGGPAMAKRAFPHGYSSLEWTTKSNYA